ncbi:MAG: MBL fold metallo-hydrolase [Acholeplasmatales bacterium]|jgi:glyoxylase-like metal-dependent hydrolase (beta-lactamase superfamily II)|nr:MBL fold metallo-hydrolase [Acholeplasmatales bacterium]
MKCLLSQSEASNTYLIERFDQVYLVDPSHNYEEIHQLLEGKKLMGILLTHGHIDHTILINRFNCPVYLHEDELELLFDDQINGSQMLGIKREFKKSTLDLRLIKDGTIIELVDRQIIVLHTPGHTRGSVCYKIGDDLITGDTLFKGSIGRTDFPGGSIRSMKESLKKIFATSNSLVKIYPGHDEISTIKEEMKHNEYYLKWVKLN